MSRGAKAIVVLPDLGTGARRDLDARLDEAAGLAEAIGIDVAERLTFKIRAPKAATLFGSGQVESIAAAAQTAEAELVIIDAPITPIQQRNLETAIKAKVIDRTGLILEIFGERAATAEGRLQVELAHLDYQAGRLVRSWTHLERQRGGFGFLGGPGETQIESDRRQLQDRIVLLEQRIDKIRRTRSQQKGRRDDVPFPVVALVGYTNAGKSSIFNVLTGAGVFAENLLFATLDTTVRKIELPHGREVMLSDTVGFVADLPTELVAAFRATLEEVVDADVILHVRDVANPDHPAQARDVLKVLNDLGVSADSIPFIEVWNKIDLLPQQRPEGVAAMGTVAATIPVSARTGEGLEPLRLAIEQALTAGSRTYRVRIPHAEGAEVGWLYGHAEVIAREESDDEGQVFEVRVEPRHKAAFTQRFAGRFESPDAA